MQKVPRMSLPQICQLSALPSQVMRTALPGLVAILAFSLAGGQATAQQQPMQPAAPTTAEDQSARDAAAAATAANADWPCVQHKQHVLTAAQMWDGPEIAAEGKRSSDADISKLARALINRRLTMEFVEAEIDKFAKTQPEAQRDKRLSELFESVLAEINVSRTEVINGIERFQRRQILRSKTLEKEGIELAALMKTAEANLKDHEAAAKAQDAQTKYDWDARVFQERQHNVPIACEIPVLIEQRAFAIAQAIRALMND